MSAQAAHTRAMAKARAEADSSHTVPCPTCKGTGKMTVIAQPGMFDDLFDTLPAASAPCATQIPCVDCARGSAKVGSGKMNPVQVAYNKHIWCSCKGCKPERVSYASDGVKVFGKPVLMCDHCGGVHSM
jgi:hypothetical protein